MIKIEKEICRDFRQASGREWLETNGIGGFAMGTISGANSRRYHSLLTAATRPPLGRLRTVAKCEETLLIGGERFELSSNQYPDMIDPQGYKYLTEFHLDPFPVWRFEIGRVNIEKKVFMVNGSNTTVCRWRVLSDDHERTQLEVRPLLAFTDYHHLSHESAEFGHEFETSDSAVRLQPHPDMPGLFLYHNGSRVEASGFWYRNFEYFFEKERGFEYHEDLFQPCVLTFDLSKPADLMISTDELNVADAERIERAEIKRRKTLITRSQADNEFTKLLTLAADQFLVARGVGQTVIAGYPWFTDWGRDTLIALSGLTLAAGQTKTAKNILLEYSKHISEGMLPNRFPDVAEKPEYNTVDATLWYFDAVRAYVEATGDPAFVRRQLYSKLSEIITWHLRGTRYGIAVDTDGLLFAGEPGVQLTWMDAKYGDEVFTPRTGKPVEIQALWYNALEVMAAFADEFGHEADAQKFRSMADLAKLSFNALFWNDEEECLFDVVCDGDADRSARPNQIFAVSLHYPILDGKERMRAVVDKVESELLTPVGLRSLSPRDPKYTPYYLGTPHERDSAYHQGTVWAWLIGPFVDAYHRVYPENKDRIKEILSAFHKHLTQAGVGQISEIFDAEWPHTPRGCPAQAWSVAELLRISRRFAP